MRISVHSFVVAFVVLLAATASASGCRSSAEDRLAVNGISPVYNQQTGKLEQLLSDRDHDGIAETRAFMDGGVIKWIEIDRDHDGKPDRWEYYGPAQGATDPASPGANVIDHAEEANGPTGRITRREYYVNGVIQRVIDDVDGDGRPDKWEIYDHGVLTQVDLDLEGKGVPTRSLHYDAQGNVTVMKVNREWP
jgi:hypothetical protein